MKLLDSLPQDVFTVEQEFALATRIQKSKNDDDINDLVLHSMKEGFLYAKKCCRANIPDDELFSLCYTALRRNAKRFRPGGIRFLAFAKAGLRGVLSRYWKTLDVVKNSSLHESKEDFNTPTKTFEMRSVEDEEDHNPAEVDAVTLGEPEWALRMAGESVEPDFRGIDLRERLGIINEIVEKKLSPQERMVIDLFYRNGFTFQRIGDMTDTTRSAAQLTHTKALRKIRRELERSKRLLEEQ
jgi:RNA polymerase sigma factor (sigma-70 family)